LAAVPRVVGHSHFSSPCVLEGTETENLQEHASELLPEDAVDDEVDRGVYGHQEVVEDGEFSDGDVAYLQDTYYESQDVAEEEHHDNHQQHHGQT